MAQKTRQTSRLIDRATRDLIEAARGARPADRAGRIGFHVPGMFVYDGRRGRYPALSITGSQCELNCGHCGGRLLKPMISATTVPDLTAAAQRIWERGDKGILISGGCDNDGRLPWAEMAEAVAHIKDRTGLIVSVHAGFADQAQARALKRAGVDLVMMDVIGDDDTLARVYNLGSPGRVADTLAALTEAGLDVAPHIVAGLHFGELRGEERAVEMVARAGIDSLVVVVFMPLKGTALAECSPPDLDEVARFLARTRLEHPEMDLHLGCAKPRGAYHRRLDSLAVAMEIDHLAIPAPEAVDLAREMGLEIGWSETCCALGYRAINATDRHIQAADKQLFGSETRRAAFEERSI